MRCDALKCKENENGYCSCSSYVEIDDNGCCKSYDVPTEFAEDDSEHIANLLGGFNYDSSKENEVLEKYNHLAR